MAARKIRLYCSTIWLSIQIPSNPVLAGAFSRIRSNEFEKTVEKEAMWAKVQMKGVPKGAPFLFPGKEGRNMAEINSEELCGVATMSSSSGERKETGHGCMA